MNLKFDLLVAALQVKTALVAYTVFRSKANLLDLSKFLRLYEEQFKS